MQWVGMWLALLLGGATDETKSTRQPSVVAAIVAEHLAAVRARDAARQNPKANASKLQSLVKRAQPDGYCPRMLDAARQDAGTPAAFAASASIAAAKAGLQNGG